MILHGINLDSKYTYIIILSSDYHFGIFKFVLKVIDSRKWFPSCYSAFKIPRNFFSAVNQHWNLFCQFKIR